MSDCLGRRLGPRFLGRGGDDSTVVLFFLLSTYITPIISFYIVGVVFF